MKHQKKRSRHAQNKIDYIVYNNPHATQDLIDKHGYHPPKNAHDLVAVTKQLVRKKGRSVVKELIQLHPDRQAILSLEKTKEDSFCGACSNYSFNPANNTCNSCGHSSYTGDSTFVDQLLKMSVLEIERLYQNTVLKSNKDPQNTDLAEEVRLIWNELRLRKKEDSPSTPNQAKTTLAAHDITQGIVVKPKEALIILGLTLVAGGLIGSAYNFQKSIA